MDHQFASSVPFNSVNNDPDPVHYLPTIPWEGLYSTQSFDTMPALGDINPLIPGQPISSYTYLAVPDIQQGPAMQQVLLSNSDNGYHNHPQQTLMPDTGLLLYDDKHSYQDEGWMQSALPTTESKPSSPSTKEATPSKKCEWKGCTFPRPFRRDAELMRHIKTVHVSRDAYKCPVCGRGFGRKDRMEDHRRTHTHNHALGGKTLLSQIRDKR